MSKSPRCSGCRHWQKLQAAPEQFGMGICRAHPPQLKPGVALEAVRHYFNWVWPITQEHDHCGEFAQQ